MTIIETRISSFSVVIPQSSPFTTGWRACASSFSCSVRDAPELKTEEFVEKSNYLLLDIKDISFYVLYKIYTIHIFHVYTLAEVGDGTMGQRSENASKHSQKNSCKMQFRIAKPCAEGEAFIYVKKQTQNNQCLCQKYEEIFITEENFPQWVQT